MLSLLSRILAFRDDCAIVDFTHLICLCLVYFCCILVLLIWFDKLFYFLLCYKCFLYRFIQKLSSLFKWCILLFINRLNIPLTPIKNCLVLLLTIVDTRYLLVCCLIELCVCDMFTMNICNDLDSTISLSFSLPCQFSLSASTKAWLSPTRNYINDLLRFGFGVKNDHIECLIILAHFEY